MTDRMKPADFAGLFPEEILEALGEAGKSGYRASQIFSWLHKGVGYDGMTNLPKALRERLLIEGIYPASILREETSVDGETSKFLFAFSDHNIVEGMLLRYRHGNTLCLSTQVGCRMGCLFCASGLEGKIRDVTAGEMLAMAALVNAKYAMENRRGVTNVVLMGSGEPLDNYDHSLRFVRLLAHPLGMSISPRNLSLSTCGLPDGIDRLAGEGLPLTLSLSLHAPDDSIRQRILPVARRYAIRDVIAACKRYARATGRRVTIEYTLIDGVNDALAHAVKLAALLCDINCHINLIPLNPIDERPEFRRPSEQVVRAFSAALVSAGMNNTVRRALGEDIQGACGQLRRKYEEDEL